MSWAFAFVLTQLLEIPVVLDLTRDDGRPLGKRLLIAFVASLITHPIVWFVLHPWLLPLGYVPFFVLAESFAIGTEALWYRTCRLDRPLRLSLAANGFSATVGLVLGAFGLV